ncbi:MAG: tetratricopeptide repeat protein [Bryobacteraceae bacterium]
MEALHLTVLRDDAAAVTYYERLVRDAKEPDRDNAIQDLARSYERADRAQEAIAQYRKLAEKDGSDGTIQLRLGVLLTRVGETDAAVAAFRKAEDYYQSAGRFNALMETLYLHAVAMRRLGQPQKAEPLLDRALEIAMLTESDRHRCQLLLEKGIVARLANDTDQAKIMWQRHWKLLRRRRWRLPP